MHNGSLIGLGGEDYGCYYSRYQEKDRIVPCNDIEVFDRSFLFIIESHYTEPPRFCKKIREAAPDLT